MKKAFGQEDLFESIEPQFAKVSLLMNHTRLEIYLYLQKNPCQHLRGISRALDLSAPTVSWHLKRLVHSNYVETAGSGGKNIFWVTGMINHDDIGRFMAFNNPAFVQILKFAIKSENGFREKDVVRTAGDEQQLVNLRLKKLVGLDLLKREGVGIRTKYYLSDNIKKMNGHYSAKISHLASSLITVFSADGLRPRTVRKRGHRLTVNLTLPGGSRTVTMDCHSMKPFLRKAR